MSDIEAVLGEDEAEVGDDIGNEEARSCHYYDNNERFLVRIRCRQAEMRLAISNTGFKAITESHLQQQLHSMRCTDPAKVNGHLDTMIQIKDNLEKRNIHINDDVFINTIIASIPKVFSPTINALIIVSSKTKT